ncbi:unnamed protein product [Zymoseptoria tritici ST99CH_3D7]|uniref:Calcineurin-like phosphoesterase domain-containing protein n=1 Tax=Zymoseptoria tritici (strain ST99CH_3D7) TaxID=1276538 RepID=A0A1X7RVA9_ZYMT9|nr:unnamed protein product [Zymoseptoria tritici ST99CH_3D7]
MNAQNFYVQFCRRTARRYPFLRRFSVTTIGLILVWTIAIYTGERSTFASHITSCAWESWEEWPQDAAPHRLVFVSDPQLVDPHTYPGRPWPLSSLTEFFTDKYMARNFRLINRELDPDSIVFLGDLFDGGREWRTSRAKELKGAARQELIDLGILRENQREGERVDVKTIEGQKVTTDLREFISGEQGRWEEYGTSQWTSEYNRFGKIFFAPEQLYPRADRAITAARDVPMDPVAIENGAKSAQWKEYHIAGGKQRKIKTNLPGNHDLGFGTRVQIPVRDRFEAHYGDTNTVYVIANHTFISLDTPSLSAADEMTDPEHKQQARLEHVWQPANDFLNKLDAAGPKVVAEALNEYFPTARPSQGFSHEVVDPKEASRRPTADKHTAEPRLPLVLLTHVPLFRPDGDHCGSQRERGRAIPISHGYQYQNVLTPGLSSTIARKISETGDLVHVFSGDDHDYCDLVHRFNVKPWIDGKIQDKPVMKAIREITVKSFSWAMGVRRPGFQLVSMWNPVDAQGISIGGTPTTIQTHLCLLPDQLSIFINYGLLLGVTLVVLIVRGVVLSLRKPDVSDLDEDDFADEPDRFSLPRTYSYHDDRPLPNGRVSGYSSPNKLPNNEAKGRQRASSTSTSHNAGNDNQHLSVQRSYNARTRSVSPAASLNGASTLGVYGMEKAGYMSNPRWHDPDQDSDEESHVGSHCGDDSQAKHDKGFRAKPPSKARRALNSFLEGLLIVSLPAGLLYGFLIKNG